MSTEADSETGTVETFLKNHPRLMGAVFMALMLLSATGSAAAGAGKGFTGP
jgi:hypothetical protein